MVLAAPQHWRVSQTEGICSIAWQMRRKKSPQPIPRRPLGEGWLSFSSSATASPSSEQAPHLGKCLYWLRPPVCWADTETPWPSSFLTTVTWLASSCRAQQPTFCLSKLISPQCFFLTFILRQFLIFSQAGRCWGWWKVSKEIYTWTKEKPHLIENASV